MRILETNMLTNHRLLPALIAMTLFAGAGCSTSTLKDYRTYVIRPTINNDPILEGEALPVQCRDETVMKVMCARGEYEPASFLVETNTPLEQVMVTVGPLKGAAGTLAPGTVDVRIAQKSFMAVTWQHDTLPWTLVHDPGMMRIIDHMPKYYREFKDEMVGPPNGRHTRAEYQAGRTKINRLVKELIDTDTLQPADIEDFRQFWLTVHMPDDARAGTYRGDVTITAANAGSTTLTLEVTVPSFDLLEPKFEYSVYYPTMLDRPDMSDVHRARYNPITDQQYLAEARNMVAHGCTNPCIYGAAERDKGGKLHFTELSRILDLREKAGMPKAVPLYMFDGGGVLMREGALTQEQKRSSTEATREIVAWVRARGYSDAFFMAGDEFSGERLRSQRDSFQAIHDGGGKIWVANQGDFLDFVGDLLDRPILSHPGAHIVDGHQQWQSSPRDWLMHRQQMLKWDPEVWLTPERQRIIRGAHKHGAKVFSYFDPQAGMQVPQMHRRHRGLGLWKTGLDGTMTWAYIHIWTKTIRPDDPDVQDSGTGPGQSGFVMRGPEGVLDTLSWEGYREGYDDARYLATLQSALARAKAAGRHQTLVARTQRWLDNLTVKADLDAWRLEMARRTELLLK